MMNRQLADLRHTLNMNILQSSLTTQVAQAAVMLNDFQQSQHSTVHAPHPVAGGKIDVKA